jgi:hypothetical protein
MQTLEQNRLIHVTRHHLAVTDELFRDPAILCMLPSALILRLEVLATRSAELEAQPRLKRHLPDVSKIVGT